MLNSLLKALNESNSVTLPNFGGLMKMGSSYMFNEFLKFNDGKFSKFLQENDKLSEQEANAKIDSFITDIKSELESKGNFSLNEIGTLLLQDGKIKLEKPATGSVKKEDKPTPKKSEPKPIETPLKEEKIVKIKAKEKEVAKVEKDKPKVQEPKTEKVKVTTKVVTDKLSADFTVKEAQEKIKSLNDKQDIIDFTKGDSRKTIIEALNQRLKSLNKIDPTELDILEATKTKKDKKDIEKELPIKEGSEKEVKKQVAKESDILNTVVEKEIADKPVSKKEGKSINETPSKEKEPVKPSTKKENIKNESSPKIKEGPKKETKKQPTEEEDLIALTEGATKLEKEAKGRKRNKIIFWIALICILSGGGIVGYLKQDMVMSWFESSDQLAQNEQHSEEETSHDETQTIENNEEHSETENNEELEVTTSDASEEIEEEVIEETLPIEEETIVEEVAVDEPIEEIRVESVNSGYYYVVVGSFSKEKNAINLVKSLKKEGYSEASIFQNGNLQSVTLGTYSTTNEAKEALKQSGKDGWVKKPK